MKKLYGHGDVIVKEIDEFPENLIKKEYTKGFSVLAYGEISGHAHCLDSLKTELYEDENGVVYLRCKEDVELKHQKLDGTQAKDAHKTITLPKNNYQIGIVKEFDYFTGEAREVAD
jgi:hypothetical protein